MPNQVQNKLTINGDKDSISQFKDLMGDKFSLEKIIATPKELLKNDSENKEQPYGKHTLTFSEGIKKGLPEWYKWRMINWGTKWDVDFCEQKGLVYQFVSAWSPPIIALANLSKKIPNLTMLLEYEEPMNDIYSSCMFAKGDVHVTDDTLQSWG
jgi:hypothetical protein